MKRLQTTIRVKANRPLTVGAGELPRLTPLGLVVAEHVDKLAFMEPGVTVVSKAVRDRELEFTLELAPNCQKAVTEIVRGFKMGCFKIAREYRLIAPGEPPIFVD